MSAIHNTHANADFDPDEAALLRDLARGSMPEAQMYYGAGMHDNDIAHSDDIDDPAALLEALANFDHPPPTNQDIVSPSDHFASLLQAAATAEGEEVSQPSGASPATRRSTRHPGTGAESSVTPTSPTNGGPKRKRAARSEAAQHEVARKRSLDAVGADQLAREREIWGPEEYEEEPHSTSGNVDRGCRVRTPDARAAGVHSAAALFRRPSQTSKKYTRPPMSKLFTSLDLTPEQFLSLQFAAKSYMLDPEHSERIDCVGNRGSGDTDMVKLKLFGCVKSFLEDEGWGDRCFGDQAPDAATRKLRWPQMKTRVISLVTPLLRRMVTNERQRKYALETRGKIGRRDSSKKKSTRQPKATSTEPSSPSVTTLFGQDGADANSHQSNIDPKLDEYQYNMEIALPEDSGSSKQNGSREMHLDPELSHPDISAGSTDRFCVQINILQDGSRRKPEMVWKTHDRPQFAILSRRIESYAGQENFTDHRIEVLSPAGLLTVDNENSWLSVVTLIENAAWMNRELKVLVHIQSST